MVARTLKRALYYLIGALGVGLALAALFLLTRTVQKSGDFDRMQEFIARSWYRYRDGDGVGLHPWRGETEFDYTGPPAPYEHLEVENVGGGELDDLQIGIE